MTIANETSFRELFTNILKQSKSINGRLYLTRNASAMNVENLEQLMIDEIGKPTQSPKVFPLVVMMPLVEQTKMDMKGYSDFIITLVFLDNPTKAQQGMPKTMIPDMIVNSDMFETTLMKMLSVSHDFIYMLRDVIKKNSLNGVIDYDTNTTVNRQRVIFTGTDKAVGVVMTFKMRGLTRNCISLDYAPNAVDNIQIPS